MIFILSLGIFLKSNIGRKIVDKQFQIPPEKYLPGTNIKLPHVIVGDEAFALQENLMKPFPRLQSLHDVEKAIYNYRLSRARRIVENAFGILTAQFRIFLTCISAKPETIDDIITSACILHNIMRDARGTTEIGRLNENGQSIQSEYFLSIRTTNGRHNVGAQEIRNHFKSYFNGVGAVSWQRNQIGLD